MIEETSAGIVLFRKEESKILFLLLHYPSGHWDFVKGKMEQGESTHQTAVRETKEETGITDITFIENFEEVEIDSVIKACSDQGKLKQSAFRYLTHSLGRRFKALTNFNVVIISQRLVYKLFWGIRFGSQFVIIDSMTGLIHPLEADFSDMKQTKNNMNK